MSRIDRHSDSTPSPSARQQRFLTRALDCGVEELVAQVGAQNASAWKPNCDAPSASAPESSTRSGAPFSSGSRRRQTNGGTTNGRTIRCAPDLKGATSRAKAFRPPPLRRQATTMPPSSASAFFSTAATGRPRLQRLSGDPSRSPSTAPMGRNAESSLRERAMTAANT